MTKQTLFQLNDTQKQLKEAILTASTSDNDEENSKMLKELFNQCKDEMRTKVDNYVYLINYLEAEVTWLTEQANQLQKEIVEPVKTKASKIQKQIDRLKSSLETVVRNNGNELKGDVFKAKIVDGSYSAKINDETKIPDIFKTWDMKIEFNKPLFTTINQIFDEFEYEKLTAVVLLKELITRLQLKSKIKQKDLVNKLKEIDSLVKDEAIKAKEENREPVDIETIKGAELKQASYTRIS